MIICQQTNFLYNREINFTLSQCDPTFHDHSSNYILDTESTNTGFTFLPFT